MLQQNQCKGVSRRRCWDAIARGRCAALICRATSQSASGKGRLVFLGTPDVAALVLKKLAAASRLPDAAFEIVGVVSQPGKPRGRGNKSTPVPTPVEATVSELGLDCKLLSPASARDPAFLDTLTALQPDLCITAAYGNMLPQRFLDIPRWGTVNIHPSLLPKYRGAAPVQRCVQSGDAIGGVSVAYTVLACDAGPIIAQKQVAIGPNIQAPELLTALFDQGAQLLLDSLPTLLQGKGMETATPQDAAAATHAAKLSKEESVLDLTRPAIELHNTVRALAGWPGTLARLQTVDDTTGSTESLDVRVIRTTLPTQEDLAAYQSQSQTVAQPGTEVGWTKEGDMLIPCGTPQAPHSVLRVSVVQPPTKKAMPAKDFRNGLRKKRLVVAAAASVAQTAAPVAA